MIQITARSIWSLPSGERDFITMTTMAAARSGKSGRPFFLRARTKSVPSEVNSGDERGQRIGAVDQHGHPLCVAADLAVGQQQFPSDYERANAKHTEWIDH